MNFKPLLFFCLLISFSCENTVTSSGNKLKSNQSNNVKLPDKNPFSSISNIPVPQGYSRIPADSSSFAGWLRNVGLKENKMVYLFDGRPKLNQMAQFAVLDISVPAKDLQQCADAVMRLRAEYLFAEKNLIPLVLPIMTIPCMLFMHRIPKRILCTIWKRCLVCVALLLYPNN